MDLVTPRIPSPAVTAATGGYAISHVLRTWAVKGVFSTALPESKAGKPRMFPLLAVYEAAMLSWGSPRGVFDLVRSAWRFHKEAVGGGEFQAHIVGDDDLLVAAARGDLAEFEPVPGAPDMFWGIYAEPLAGGDQRMQLSSGAPIVGTWAEIGARVFGQDREGAVLINVSALVRNVNRRLEAL